MFKFGSKNFGKRRRRRIQFNVNEAITIKKRKIKSIKSKCGVQKEK